MRSTRRRPSFRPTTNGAFSCRNFIKYKLLSTSNVEIEHERAANIGVLVSHTSGFGMSPVPVGSYGPYT